MKNKSTTILLTILLIIVWGTIGYKIYSSTKVELGNISHDYTAEFRPPETSGDEEYSLCLEYDDPFLGKKVRNREKKPLKIKAVKTNFNWGGVRYKGCIYNKKSLLGMLEVNGKLGFVRKGEKYEGMHVIKLYRDSVKLGLNGENRCIRVASRN